MGVVHQFPKGAKKARTLEGPQDNESTVRRVRGDFEDVITLCETLPKHTARFLLRELWSVADMKFDLGFDRGDCA